VTSTSPWLDADDAQPDRRSNDIEVPPLEEPMTTSSVSVAASRRTPLVGNGIVLSGMLVYLLEFVGFAIAGVGSLYNEPGTTAKAVLSSYAGDAGGYGFLVGWMAIVLFGRLAVIVGVRKALNDSGRSWGLMDVAVVAMGASVIFEVASVTAGAAAAALVDDGTEAGVLAVDRVAWYFNSAIYAPVAVALVITLAAMWRSGLLPRTLCAIGSLAAAMCAGSALLTDPAHWELQDTLSIGMLPFVVWAFWTGVLLVRRRTRG
jgi:hypothetical protein